MPVMEGQRFVDCGYCGSRSEVVIPESETAELSAQIEGLKLREELRTLDAAWKRYLGDVSVRVQSGDLHPPDATVVVESAMTGLVATGLASVALVQVWRWSFLVAIPVGLWITWKLVANEREKRRAFESAMLLHDSRRRELLRRIERNARATR